MGPAFRLFCVAVMGLSLSSCVAAIIPILATGALGSQVLTKPPVVAVAEYDAQAAAAAAGGSFIPGQANAGNAGFIGTAPGGTVTADSDTARSAMAQLAEIANRYSRLAGGGQYRGFLAYGLEQAKKYAAGKGVRSVVLQPDFSIENPQFMPCTALAPAVMVDLDNSASLGAGANALASEDAVAVEELAAALSALRANDITIVWLSDRADSEADTMIAELRQTALQTPGDGDFLSLARSAKDSKQQRRIEASSRFCIVAMVGDNRSDFDQLFGYLRDPENFVVLNHMWDAGWFRKPVPDVSQLVTDTDEDLVPDDASSPDQLSPEDEDI